VEDRADDLGLGLVDLDPRSAGVGVDDAAVPVGALPERDLPGAGAIKLAATVTLGDLRLLVLRDHTLHLDQQRRLWIVARFRALEEVNGDPEALEFLEDQDLVGVGARESIDTQAQHAVQHARLGGVTQAIQRRAIQPRTRVAIVDELVDHLMPVGLGRRAQHLELRPDGAAFGLALCRDPRVEPDPHSPTARNTSP